MTESHFLVEVFAGFVVVESGDDFADVPDVVGLRDGGIGLGSPRKSEKSGKRGRSSNRGRRQKQRAEGDSRKMGDRRWKMAA